MRNLSIALLVIISLVGVWSYSISSTETIYMEPPIPVTMIVSQTTEADGTRVIDSPSLGQVTLSKPASQPAPASIVSTNVPLCSDAFNNPQAMEFFNSTNGHAAMISHFNCKGAPPTCQEFKFPAPTPNLCIFMANVDAYDHVTIESSNQGTMVDQNNWSMIGNGSMALPDPNTCSTSGAPQCANAVQKNNKDHVSLGCFDKPCSNPNYNILRANGNADYVKICYQSFSQDSEYVMYNLGKCPPAVILTPPSAPIMGISGKAFTDVNTNGKYDEGVDTPLPGIAVTVLADGVPVRDFQSQVRIPDAITNAKGDYVIQGFSYGQFSVKFAFNSATQKATTPQGTDVKDPVSSKIGANFITKVLTVNPGTASPVKAGDGSGAVGFTRAIMKNINGGVVPK
eukprot:gene15507-18418_t